MAHGRSPSYARKPSLREPMVPAATCSASRNIAISRDNQGIVFGRCLDDLVMIHDHYRRRAERIVAAVECFEPRKEPRYELRLLSSVHKGFTVKVIIRDGAPYEYGREECLD